MSEKLIIISLFVCLALIGHHTYLLVSAGPIAHKQSNEIADALNDKELKKGFIDSKEHPDELVLAMDPDEGVAGHMIVVKPSNFALSDETYDEDYGDGDDDHEAMLVGKNKPR